MTTNRKNEPETESEKTVLTRFIQNRLELNEREARLIAQNIAETQYAALAGVPPEKLLNAIQKFLNDFSGDTGVLEQKFQNKQNRISKTEKRKTQIDFFSPDEE